MTSFELLCIRAVFSWLQCVVTVKLLSWVSVSTKFCAEMTDVLDRSSAFIDPLYIVGDVNVYLTRLDDPTTRDLIDVFTDHGLSSCVTSPTHVHGGMSPTHVTVAFCRDLTTVTLFWLSSQH
jgi:hypothetical protein